MVKQPITSRRAVYGQVRVSGPLAFIGTTDDDQFLHLVVLLASHEIEAVDAIYLNEDRIFIGTGDLVTNPDRYDGKVKAQYRLGTTDQAALPDMISDIPEWTANHRLQGIAYLYVRLEFDDDAFPNGIPNISALIRGKKLYDPRTGNTSYSENAALAIRDRS